MYYSYHNRLKKLLETEKYICVPDTRSADWLKENGFDLTIK